MHDGQQTGEVTRSRPPLAGRAGRWSAAHWKTAVAAWFGFVIVAILVGGAVGTKNLSDADQATLGSATAEHILARGNFRTPASESVLVQSRDLSVSDRAFRAAVRAVIGSISANPIVFDVRSPLDPANRGSVSRDGHSALVQFKLRGSLDNSPNVVQPIMDSVAAVQRRHPTLFISEFGEASAAHVLNDTIGADFQRAEYTSIPVTLAILLLAFGAAVAAGLPVLLAFSGVLATTGLAQLASHVIPAASPTKSVILLIGMAVGVDYSLFYIRREREERARGIPHRRALLKTADTSGQAVLISGLTVLIAMAGMLLSGSKIFTSLAVGAMLMVAVALVGSLSILPALLSKLGDRVNRGRIPFLGRRLARSPEPRLWSAVLDVVLRRPALSAAASAGLLIALALPTLTLHTQLPSFTDLPRDIPIVATYDRIQAAFPGAQTPAEVVIQAPDVTAPAVRSQVAALIRESLATGQMKLPVQVRVNGDHTVGVVNIPLQGDGNNAASQTALHTLRGTLIPHTVGRLSGVTVAVTGQTAGTSDFNQTMISHMPYVFGFVLLLVFVLLLASFRSIVVPIKAVVLNLLSVGAAYGVLVLIFQHTWAEGVLNFRSNGAIASWLPLFLFVILFGLSMDYHVFILSRVRELVDEGYSTEQAVATGIKRTASVVTSAAFVMVAVFAIFATLRTLDIKQLGVGLAVAILIDSTLIRAVLLPATMTLLGDWNWYLPHWLEWIPRLTPEPHGGFAPPPAGAPGREPSQVR